MQRIGKAREEAAAAAEGPQSGASGAKAAPQLGYVERNSGDKGDKARVARMKKLLALAEQRLQNAFDELSARDRRRFYRILSGYPKKKK